MPPSQRSSHKDERILECEDTTGPIVVTVVLRGSADRTGPRRADVASALVAAYGTAWPGAWDPAGHGRFHELCKMPCVGVSACARTAGRRAAYGVDRWAGATRRGLCEPMLQYLLLHTAPPGQGLGIQLGMAAPECDGSCRDHARRNRSGAVPSKRRPASGFAALRSCRLRVQIDVRARLQSHPAASTAPPLKRPASRAERLHRALTALHWQPKIGCVHAPMHQS